MKNRRIFLLHCKTQNIQPKFLNFKLSHITFRNDVLESKFNNTVSTFKITLINQLITDTVIYIRELNHRISIINRQLSNIINTEPALSFNKKIHQIAEIKFQKIKTKNQKKIKNLKHSFINNNTHSHNKRDIDTPHNWIENLSNTKLPDNVKKVLSLGPKFNLEYTDNKHLPIDNIIANIEASIDHLNENNKNDIRSNVCKVITNFKNTTSKTKSSQHHDTKLNYKQIKETKQFIKKNPQIVITKPDKSNKTVILNKQDYEEKMNFLLSDSNTYEKLKTDPTNKYQKQNNDLIKKWENGNLISANLANKLKINNSHSPKIYGLPKLHKEGIPLRPIVSCIQSPFYKLSKFLANIISNITSQNNYYIKNSFQFKDFIDTIELNNNEQIISLDVVSMYTNIPIDLAKHILQEKWHKIEKFTDLPMKEFLKAVEIALTSTYFQYNNCFYRQKDGCAMGAPISSVIAQLVLEHVEETTLPKLSFNPVFFKRYVDDIITAVPKNKIDEILSTFNTYHPKLNFTLETEKNNTINFLDLSLFHQGNKIKTKHYQKPTNSGRYLNFHSSQHISHKTGVMISLIDRAIYFTSPEFRKNTLDKIKDILTQNCYPSTVINKTIKKRLHRYYNKSKFKNTHNSKNNENKNIKYISIPYIHILSQQLNKIVKPYNIQFAYKSTNSLNSLHTNLKDKIQYMKQTHTVYKVPCQNCDAVYIGQSIQHLNERLNGHKFAKNKTALKKHVQITKHNFNFNDTKILNKEINNKSRNFLEMIQIKRHTHAVNDKTDIGNLSKIYHSLIK